MEVIQVGSMNGEIVEKIVRKTVGNIEDKAIYRGTTRTLKDVKTNDARLV